MTENENAAQGFVRDLEYAETFIGECIVGRCPRVATVRIHEDFVLCALHHLEYEVGQDHNEATLALELIAGWRSVAALHNNDYLLELFEYAKGELLELQGRAERRSAQLERAEKESEHGEQLRLRTGEKAAE